MRRPGTPGTWQVLETLHRHQYGIDGGWDVDALLGEQMREHLDLDLAGT
jgi:hypothetical protein